MRIGRLDEVKLNAVLFHSKINGWVPLHTILTSYITKKKQLYTYIYVCMYVQT